jgi:PAS domain S-box-containing protein
MAENGAVQNELTLRQIADGISAPLAVMTPEGAVEIVNRQILDYFGKTLEELKAWSSSDAVHPDDLPGVITGWTRSIESGQRYNSEHRQRGADGVYRWFHVQGLPVRDDDSRILRWFVLQTDIDERKRAEGLLAGENLVLEMIAKGSSLESILEAVCRLVEQTADGSCCSVLVFDPGESTIQQVVAPSLPSSYNDRFPGTPVNREGGPCTVAAHHKTQMIVSDLASDTRWDAYGWRTAALTHGLKACWSTTILAPNGLVLGTFAIYWHESRRPTDQDHKIIEQMTHLAAVAIERKRNEAALRDSAHELRLVFETIPAMVYTMDAEGDIELVNERLLAFLGKTFYFDRQGLLKRHDYDVDVAGGAAAAHYVSALTDVSGVVVPTKHTIFPRQPDGSSAPTPVVVSIDISEIEFKQASESQEARQCLRFLVLRGIRAGSSPRRSFRRTRRSASSCATSPRGKCGKRQAQMSPSPTLRTGLRSSAHSVTRKARTCFSLRISVQPKCARTTIAAQAR